VSLERLLELRAWFFAKLNLGVALFGQVFR